ncbi:MAG: DUF3837 family protein [Lachnospiraceae bacterium]|jgi:ABC-type Na+ transport system ATPase subunit NatA|nr:DUF3837 family protein [Lachnospiraceae bacterium]
MVYSIIYDAVNKKVETEIPNKLISNLEMVAAIYQVLAELGVDDISETLKIQELMDEINDEKSKDTKKNILLATKLKENFLLLDVDENRSKGISVRTELIKKYKILDPDHGEVDDLLKVVTGKIE